MIKKLRALPAPGPLGKRVNPNEGRCTLIVGRLGSGKTSYAMHRAVRFARRYRLPLYANAAVRPDARVLGDWSDLEALPTCRDVRDANGYQVDCRNGCHKYPNAKGCHPAVIVLDELHLWYPSATGLMPKERLQDAFELLSYARKRGWTVFATTQAPTRVHTGYRQIMTELLRVHPMGEGILHRVASLDPDTGEQILGFAGVFNPRRARYNTRAEVTPLWAAGKRARPASAATGTPTPPVLPAAMLNGLQNQNTPGGPLGGSGGALGF